MTQFGARAFRRPLDSAETERSLALSRSVARMRRRPTVSGWWSKACQSPDFESKLDFWYAEQVAYHRGKLDAVDEGTGTRLLNLRMRSAMGGWE